MSLGGESLRETKVAAERRGLPWFRFTYYGAIKNGKAWSSAERFEVAGPITKKCAAAIFALIGKDEKKAARAASPEGRA